MIKMNEENRLIIKQLNKFGKVLETSELLEMIEKFELSLKCANEMLEIQGRDGNYNYDSYMLGMYNGMEYIISLFEHREPNYRNGKEIEFLSDKQLQNNWNELKKFIEKELDRLVRECSQIYEDSLGKTRLVNEDIYNEVKNISNKMQELEGNNE